MRGKTRRLEDHCVSSSCVVQGNCHRDRQGTFYNNMKRVYTIQGGLEQKLKKKKITVKYLPGINNWYSNYYYLYLLNFVFFLGRYVTIFFT